ncbi:MAG: hypothetical protein EP319_08400 [Deltaproteobacteria bacterium]|nr:MAG: hypothetical protein EP319_08400 [Deltaproteobacteria bacterium]
MKVILATLFMLFSTTSSANTAGEMSVSYPYFHLKKEDIDINRAVFLRYVRPQLKSIVKEYFHILKKLEPSQENLIELWSNVQTLNDLWVKWKLECPVSSEEVCRDTLKEIYKESRKLDLVTLDFHKNHLGYRGRSGDYIDNVIKLSNSLDNIHNMNYRVMHIIEEAMLIRGTPYNPNALVNESLTSLLHEMLVDSELILSSLLEKDFRPIFDLVWASFIKRIERQILFKDDKDFLVEHLGNLNLAWNTFHMKVSKSDLRLPKAQLQIVTIMHNRWNSVLKVMLRRN